MPPASDFIQSGRKFSLDSGRLVLLGLGVVSIYGAGVGAATWAGILTARVMHQGGEDLPILPWALAFMFIIAGILSVVYAVFFRPRELRLSEREVSILIWDGTGKTLRRDQLEKIEASPGRVVLRGAGKTLVADRKFSDWENLRDALIAWARQPKAA